MHEYISNGQFKNNRTIARDPVDFFDLTINRLLFLHIRLKFIWKVIVNLTFAMICLRHTIDEVNANFDLNGCSMADKTVRWKWREKKHNLPIFVYKNICSRTKVVWKIRNKCNCMWIMYPGSKKQTTFISIFTFNNRIKCKAREWVRSSFRLLFGN